MSASPEDLAANDETVALRRDLVDLTRKYDKLLARTSSGERQRKAFLISQTALWIAFAVMLGFIIYILHGRANARKYYNDSIMNLICAAPPRDQEIIDLRRAYKCGPYVGDEPARPTGASQAPTPRPTAAPIVSAASLPTSPAVTHTVARAAPQPTVVRTIVKPTPVRPSPVSIPTLTSPPTTAPSCIPVLDPILVILFPNC